MTDIVGLTPFEGRVLALLEERRGSLVLCDALFGALWPDGHRPGDPDNVLKVLICRVRSKHRAAGVAIDLVTHRHAGYELRGEAA